MLKRRCILIAKPGDDLLKALARTSERVLHHTILAREIAHPTISSTPVRQDFITTQGTLPFIGAGVGDHGSHLSVDAG
ncbi:MAG: hypothetical protein ACLP01_22865 [Solirubrobacteraceae bacterium]